MFHHRLLVQITADKQKQRHAQDVVLRETKPFTLSQSRQLPRLRRFYDYAMFKRHGLRVGTTIAVRQLYLAKWAE
jgi:hypothetical protein